MRLVFLFITLFTMTQNFATASDDLCDLNDNVQIECSYLQNVCNAQYIGTLQFELTRKGYKGTWSEVLSAAKEVGYCENFELESEFELFVDEWIVEPVEYVADKTVEYVLEPIGNFVLDQLGINESTGF